jgi:hypothetical protein
MVVHAVDERPVEVEEKGDRRGHHLQRITFARISSAFARINLSAPLERV